VLIVDVRDTVTGAHTILNTDVTGGFQLELGSGKFQVELINPATGLHTGPQSITLTDLNRQLNFESPSFLTPSEPIPITGRTFNGGNKADALTGTSADDLIRGNGGGDRLNGGAGQDQIWGGAGADLFYLVPGGGHDIVMDWSHAQGDRLNVHDVGLATFADVQACTKPTANGALITAPSGDQILLAGVQASSLVSRDFLF